MARKKKSAEPTFAVGDRVRVKPGRTDPDFPDVPLGGWVGVVEEPEKDGTILIRWTKETLRKMPKIFKIRCERDQLQVESMYLVPSDVQFDDGSPVVLEKPKAIVPRPLDMQDEYDRIRAGVGLTCHDDDIPRVSYKTLSAYWRYLQEQLPFPFLVQPREETDLAQAYPGERFLLLRLLPPKRRCKEEGLIAELRREQHPSRKLSPDERNESFEVPLVLIVDPDEGEQAHLVYDYQYYFEVVGSDNPAT